MSGRGPNGPVGAGHRRNEERLLADLSAAERRQLEGLLTTWLTRFEDRP